MCTPRTVRFDSDQSLSTTTAVKLTALSNARNGCSEGCGTASAKLFREVYPIESSDGIIDEYYLAAHGAKSEYCVGHKEGESRSLNRSFKPDLPSRRHSVLTV